MRRIAAVLTIITAQVCAMPSSAQGLTATAVPSPPVAQVAVAPKMHCKSYVETGSLAKVHKECHTDVEWRRMADDERDKAWAFLGSSAAEGGSAGH